MQQFQKWFFEADEIFNEYEPNVMRITTIGTDNYPKTRVVLLKKYTWEGFIFFTNYKSDKAHAIAKNPKVSLFFNWTKSKRMVLITGKTSKISREISSNYFDSRPRGSKLGAWVSMQSQIINSRTELENKLAHFEKQFKGKEITRPDYWGGYIVKPKTIEFIEQQNDIFIRESYTLNNNYNWFKKNSIGLGD